MFSVLLLLVVVARLEQPQRLHEHLEGLVDLGSVLGDLFGVFGEFEVEHGVHVGTGQAGEAHEGTHQSSHDGCVGVGVSGLLDHFLDDAFVVVVVEGGLLVGLAEFVEAVHAVGPGYFGPSDVRFSAHFCIFLCLFEPFGGLPAFL